MKGPCIHDPHGIPINNVIKILVLGNRRVFMTVAASKGHGITICNLPSWILISKINRGSQICLMIVGIT